MPLTFLVPAMLAGLAALLVPVLIHLRRREREKPTRFPSLMFLQRVPIVTARRRRVTDWPLLLLRLAILALLVLAFARPVVRPKPGAVVKGARRVALLIDRSMSMGHAAVWPAAVDSARRIIRGLGSDDRIAVIAFDDEATVVQPFTLDHDAALAALDRIHPGARGTRFGAGLRAARELFTQQGDATGGEVLVVTDLQRSGAASVAGLSLPPNLVVRAVDASPRAHGNTAVTAVDVQRLPGGAADRGRLVVAAHLAATGLAAPRQAHVTLMVNGRNAGTRLATIPANGTVAVGFDPVALPVGSARIVVAADPDSLPADDTFRAVIPADATRRILLVVPNDAAAAETFYLERALMTGDDPAFLVDREPLGSLDAGSWRAAAAVWFYDVAPPGGAVGSALAGWVHDGGGVVIAAGTRLGAAGHAVANGSPVLPGTIRGMVDRLDDRGGMLGDVALDHPIWSPFRGGGNAALGGPRFYRYPRVTADSDAQVLARFDDGNPALLERHDAAGHILLAAMPLDTTSGNFPLQPAYLPFLRDAALYVAGQAAAPLWHNTGDGWLLPAAVREPVIRSPSDSVIRVDRQRDGDAVALAEAGFYSLYDTRPSGDPAATVAVNPPARESDLSRMPPKDLLLGVGEDTLTASQQATVTLTEAERRQRLWRILLELAIALLLVETITAAVGWRGTAARFVGAAPERSES